MKARLETPPSRAFIRSPFLPVPCSLPIMFSKVLVANRGEIAVRVIRACREMGIQSVAVHSSADTNSRAVQLANESVCIGPPAAKESYLNVANVVSAAIITGADAIHPGYGFLSENSSFAEVCEQANIKFIGPPPSAIDRMGNKASAREAMRLAGVPIMPGTPGPVDGEEEAMEAAKKIGFPVIIKASAGGGGKGMRVVLTEDELPKMLQMAQNEASAAFGNDEVYIEKYLIEPRHIEVQILADSFGNVVHLGERDCSVQTARHQKMLEEAPCAFITRSNSPRALAKLPSKAPKRLAIEGAGTMEFLVSKNGEFYFMEMNTRIQVEHPVTEEITNIDLIRRANSHRDGRTFAMEAGRRSLFSGHCHRMFA